MKKLVLFAAIAFAASMVACSSSENKAEAEENAGAAPVEAVEVVEEEVVAPADTTAAEAPAEAPAEEAPAQ